MPMFSALSYVWGDATKSHEILVDGKSLSITKSLYDGLRAMQKDSAANFHVWADAICIDQNNLAERSAQILLMREIYHSATTVRIWLGSGSAEGKRCLDFIDKLTGALIMTDDPTETEDSALEEAFSKSYLMTGEALSRGLIRIGQAFGDMGDIIRPAARDDRAELLMDPDESFSLHQNSIESISEWRPSTRRLKKVEYEGDFTEIATLLEKLFLQNDWFSRMWVVQVSS